MIKSEIDFELKGKSYNVKQVLWTDMSDFAASIDQWTPQRWEPWHSNGLAVHEAKAAVRQGLTRTVDQTNKLLEQFEDRQHEHTTTFKPINDICGGAPNVGAYLAGNPLNMRRRQRTLSPVAPLTIYCDLTSSGGIAEYILRKRGIALLALTRVLSTLRPVTLRVGCALGNWSQHGTVCGWATLDTAPLDLARADFMLTHAAVSRGMFYSIMPEALGGTQNSHGSWPMDDYQKWIQNAAAVLRQISGDDEILYIPAVFADDRAKVWDAPAAWVSQMVEKHGGHNHVDEEAA